ncbi:MAG: NFACT RNA binding domain-containing protein [Candidatus Hydrothermales bacterium]
MHFSQIFFPILKKEIDEIFKFKRVKNTFLKDKKIFIIFENNLALMVSLHPEIYYFLPTDEQVGKFEKEKEFPYIKDFLYKDSEILEGERVFFINFIKKNPLGEIEERKLVIDFTKRARDLLILKDNRVIYSFRKKKEFNLSFSQKPHFFKEPFDEEFKEKLIKDFSGFFFVDKNLRLTLKRSDDSECFDKLYKALLYIYRLIEKNIEEKKSLKKFSVKDNNLNNIKVDPEIYKIKAEAILINLKEIKDKKGLILLKHPEKGEIEVEIKHIETPQKAAERYFNKYKKLKRKEEIEKVLDKIKEEKSLPYKVYISPSGFKVLVSKSVEKANELTFKLAKPWDYFFHLKELPSAHVILKREKNQKIKEEDIRFAAEVTKRHSKLKENEKALVLYTLRKYVKPVKGKKGAVKVLRENVIFL